MFTSHDQIQVQPVRHRGLPLSAALAGLLLAQSAFAGAGNQYCVNHPFDITTSGNVAPEVKFTYNVYAKAQTNSCKDIQKEKGTIVIAGTTTKSKSALAPNSAADASSVATIDILQPGRVAGSIEANGNVYPDWQGCPPGATRGWGRATAYSAAALKVRGQKLDRRGNIKYTGNWKHVPPVVGSTTRGVSRDPIIARLFDYTTGNVQEWVLFSIKTTSSDGEVAWQSGLLRNTATNMSLHIKLGAPVTVQQGELKVSIENGIVTELVQLGLFSTMPLPPVGSLGAFSVSLPQLSIDFDMGGDETHDLVPELDFDNAGQIEKDAAGEQLGSVVTDLGMGFDGSNLSELPLNDTVYGYPITPGFQHLADDFTVPPGDPMLLEALTLPGYQLFGPGSLPFEGVYVRIWRGQPGAGGILVAGNMTSNRLLETEDTLMHRVHAENPHDQARKLKDMIVDLAWAPPLPPGQYWIELAAQGNPSFGQVEVPATPWASEADNAIMFFPQFNGFQPLVDFGSGRRVGLPMTIHALGLGIQLCPEDISGNGVVDIDDLVQVIISWGQPGGPADINNDGIVNIDDLVRVITTWGPCVH